MGSIKTASGFDENVAGALCYGLGWVTGVVFFATEPENRFVRFHAMQSMIAFGIGMLAWAYRPGRGTAQGAPAGREKLAICSGA